jgi:hypothetical protein
MSHMAILSPPRHCDGRNAPEWTHLLPIMGITRQHRLPAYSSGRTALSGVNIRSSKPSRPSTDFRLLTYPGPPRSAI